MPPVAAGLRQRGAGGRAARREPGPHPGVRARRRPRAPRPDPRPRLGARRDGPRLASGESARRQRRHPAPGADRRAGPRGPAGWACNWRPNAGPIAPPSSRPRRTPMPTVPSPQTLLDRVRRDVERNALRARNGIKLITGSTGPASGRPRRTSSGSGVAAVCGATATRRVATARRCSSCSAWSRSYILDLTPGNSFVEQLRRRRLRRLPARLGHARRTGLEERTRGLRRRLHPGRRSTACCELSGADGGHLFGYCFGGDWPCCTPRTTRTPRCAASRC